MSTSATEIKSGPQTPRTRWMLTVCGVIFVLTMLGVPCLLMIAGAVAESIFVVP